MENNTTPQESANQRLVISYLALRRGVGIIGILLPVILVVGMLFVKTCRTIQPSISDYYYTMMGNVLVGSLCAVGLFLFSYRGYEKKDMIAGKLASLFAVCIAFFPTGGPDAYSGCNFLHRNSDSWVSTIHDISAAAFFLTLAYFSLFLFTIKSDNPTDRKLMRNNIYRICGYTILLCIIFLCVYFNVKGLRVALQDYKPVFAMETIALWAFGFSWLTKGDAILKDK
jgi:succinate dehydrogenase/fumarate reductase cytochrome b subunit